MYDLYQSARFPPTPQLQAHPDNCEPTVCSCCILQALQQYEDYEDLGST
jgi:hypothetical protein